MSTVLKKFTDSYFASCPKGLEEVLEKELTSLGASETQASSRGVHFKISKSNLAKVIFYSRIASRIFMKLFDFDVKKEKDIYIGLKSINWTRFFKVEHSFKFQFTQAVSPKLKKKSQFNNLKYLSFVAKDALVDRFQREIKQRPDINLKEPDVLINCHLVPNDNPHSKKERLTVLLDLIGRPLCHRGYRESYQMAPVRENLAAGLIDMMNWDVERERFIDITCGSGTFLFEALIKKYELPANYANITELAKDPHLKIWNFLKYDFLRSVWKSKEFKSHLAQAHERIEGLSDKKVDLEIFGNDIRFKTLENLREIVSELSWSRFIKVKKSDARTFEDFGHEKCLLFSNPPYGERIGEVEKLEKLYFDLGENFKNTYKLSRFGIISSNLDLLKKIRLKPSLKKNFSHGSLDCRLHVFENF